MSSTASNFINSTHFCIYLCFFNIILFIHLFTAGLGLCCYVGFSLVVVSGDCSLGAVRGPFTAVVSLVVEHRL